METPATAVDRGGKNIVLCCDGTGQTIRAARGGQRPGPMRTNVLRLYDLLEKDTDRQVACYDPGIGTIPGLEGEQRLLRTLRNARDEWLGSGLMANVAEMYAYLMERYEPGDRVFLFGFSRGAFTVRALAGLIRCIGLLSRGHVNLLPYARDLFENMEARHRRKGWKDVEDTDPDAAEFRRFSRAVAVKIAFLGVWDTVKAYGYLRPKGVPHVRNNTLVDVVRHAVAIDEKRPPFQLTGWSDRQLRREHGDWDQEAIDKRVQEVWFAGDHSDVGGGHEDDENGFWRPPFDWILGEAMRQGLHVASSRYAEVVGGVPSSAPQLSGVPHDLSREGIGQLMWIPPRQELDNSHFPPRRAFQVLARTGRRRLLDHTFPDRVWRDAQATLGLPLTTPFLFVHGSVPDRYRRGEDAPGNLKEVFAAEARGEVEIRWVAPSRASPRP
jgi:uncharacterized protein (DUF2235 family)